MMTEKDKDQPPWVKEASGFRVHRTSLETKPEKYKGYLTPNNDFFVCNDAGSVRGVDLDAYRLRIEGDGIENPLSLSYDQLLSLPSHTVLCYLECAGNMRQLYEEVMGQDIDEYWTHWLLGGVGMAEWTGTPVKEVLNLAGLKSDAFNVNFKGLDQDASEGGINRPIPIEKAMDPDTILAYSMNGETLPPDHGYPIRSIVPGWVGTNSVKWVGVIHVSTQKVWVERNTSKYVLVGPEWPDEETAPAKGGEITTQNIKSSLALPWKAVLEAGKHTLRGYARSPHGIITSVEWSANQGETWQQASLLPPFLKYGWVRFEFEWRATPGDHSLMTRATDDAGNTQPMSQPFNQQGYLFNRVYPHPIHVS